MSVAFTLRTLEKFDLVVGDICINIHKIPAEAAILIYLGNRCSIYGSSPYEMFMDCDGETWTVSYDHVLLEDIRIVSRVKDAIG